jgi:restriction endonuclease fold toxin 5 of polymorphic toxin system
MSEQARAYQAQVTGAPKRWCYKVCRDGDCVDYDGYDPKAGILLEAKAREYDKWFSADLKPKWNYQGLKGMLDQARRQFRLSGGLRLRWHVAEPRMVAILRKHLDAAGLADVEVVYTPPLPP